MTEEFHWRVNNGRHPLHVAAEADDIAAVHQLLADGAAPNLPDTWQRRPLHYAALQGSITAARLLLDAGAEVDASGKAGVTPLACAVYSWRPSPDLVQLLRSHGADPFRPDRIGRTPRHWAAADIHIDLLSDLPVPPPLPRHPALDDSDELLPDELDAVAYAVAAVVNHDESALRAMHAYDYGAEPYLWTEQYGPWPKLTLRMPPGPAALWDIASIRFEDESGFTADVEMWARESGPSDLTLELEFHRDSDGDLSATFRDLHVM